MYNGKKRLGWKKRLSTKTHCLNIFKNHYIVAYSDPAAVGYDEWKIPEVLRIYYSHGKTQG